MGENEKNEGVKIEGVKKKASERWEEAETEEVCLFSKEPPKD